MASLDIARGTGNLEATIDDVVRLGNLGWELKNDVLSTIPVAPLKLHNGQPSSFTDEDDHFIGSCLDGCTLFMFTEPKINLVSKLGSYPVFGTMYFYDRKSGSP